VHFEYPLADIGGVDLQLKCAGIGVVHRSGDTGGDGATQSQTKEGSGEILHLRLYDD
jgi:hypothetical protein